MKKLISLFITINILCTINSVHAAQEEVVHYLRTISESLAEEILDMRDAIVADDIPNYKEHKIFYDSQLAIYQDFEDSINEWITILSIPSNYTKQNALKLTTLLKSVVDYFYGQFKQEIAKVNMAVVTNINAIFNEFKHDYGEPFSTEYAKFLKKYGV